MKRVFILKGLDCPNCSAKIEKEVGELDGVTSSTVNLMNQTLTVQAGTSVAASLLDTVTTIVHSHGHLSGFGDRQAEWRIAGRFSGKRCGGRDHRGKTR